MSVKLKSIILFCIRQFTNIYSKLLVAWCKKLKQVDKNHNSKKNIQQNSQLLKLVRKVLNKMICWSLAMVMVMGKEATQD